MSPTTLSEGTYTYYAECADANGCVSPRTAVTLTIDAKPAAPVIADETICENGTITDISPFGGCGEFIHCSRTIGSCPDLSLTLLKRIYRESAWMKRQRESIISI